MNTLISNPKSTLFTSELRFLDVEQSGRTNLTIQGGTTTKIQDYLKNVFIECDVGDIKIHKSLQCLSTLTASKIYSKTEVDALINNIY